MMKFKRMSLISCILCMGFANISMGATEAQLQSVLQKYGVPQAKDCGTKNEAHFNGALPECQDEGMYYDKKNRRCDYCEIGYATDSKTDTECKPIVCPAGFGGVIIRDGLCPAGYGLFQITGGNCPAGTILTKT